jgi:outer membrane protein assembly factor BamA
VYSSLFFYEPSATYLLRPHDVYSAGSRFLRYQEERVGGAFVAGWNIEEWMRVMAEYSISRVRLSPEIGPSYLLEPATEKIGHGAARFQYDTLDDSCFPTRGGTIGANLMLSHQTFGSERRFGKAWAEATRNYTVGEVHTFSGRAFAGFGWDYVPLYELYNLGGMSYVQGYNPVAGFNRDEFLGRNAVATSLSYRIRALQFSKKFIRSVYAAYMFETGSKWGGEGDAGKAKTTYGNGIGIYVDTVIGPTRVNGGIGEGGRSGIYFSSGYEF